MLHMWGQEDLYLSSICHILPELVQAQNVEGHWALVPFFLELVHVAAGISFGPWALTFLSLFGTLLGHASMHLQKAGGISL